ACHLLCLLPMGRRVRGCRVSFQRWVGRFTIPRDVSLHRLPRGTCRLEKHPAYDVCYSAWLTLRVSCWVTSPAALAAEILSCSRERRPRPFCWRRAGRAGDSVTGDRTWA